MNNLDRFDFDFDATYELDYALNANPERPCPHLLVRRDTKETVAEVRDPELAIALAAVWNERRKLKAVEAPEREPEVREPWFRRESGMRCPVCCARKGEPHTPECTETGLA